MKLDLSIYLFKPTVKGFKEVMLSGKGRKKLADGKYTIRKKQYPYEIYLVESAAKQPDWAKLIQNKVKSADFTRGVVRSALIVIKAPTSDGERIFAITFGYARFQIDQTKVEPKFGLKTTLNSIDAEKIKSVSSQVLGTKTMQRLENANLNSTINDFTFEFDSELLRIIEGVCVDESIGGKISGSDVLHIRTDVTFDKLPKRCIELYELYKQDTYKGNFDFVDYFEVEKDIGTISTLDDLLITDINSKVNNGNISIVLPVQYQNTQVSYVKFKLTGTGRRVDRKIYDLSISDIYTELASHSITREELTEKFRIVGYDSDDKKVTKNIPFYDFFIYEITYSKKKYILSQGTWYRVEDSYLTELDRKLRTIVKAYDGPKLANWKPSWNEGKYNSSYSTKSDYLVLDKVNFGKAGTSGRGKIEVADIFYLKENKLFAVKPLSASSTLSHLFSQGSVSATLFNELDEYREFFLNKVKTKWPGKYDKSKLSDLTFVYAISTKRKGDPFDLLPFFSKINLVRHAKRIVGLGYKVQLAKIDIK